MAEYTRKALADRLGIGIETLRYYEEAGVITPPERRANGYRVYSELQEEEVRHFLEAKRYGFSPSEVRGLMDRAARKDITKTEALAIAREKIASLEREIEELGASKDRLERYIRGLGEDTPSGKS
jgi:DNA-binding transcriptional MerR regulator